MGLDYLNVIIYFFVPPHASDFKSNRSTGGASLPFLLSLNEE